MRILVLVFSLAAIGCSAHHDESKYSSSSRELTAGEAYQLALSRYDAGRILYESNCASCHGGLSASNKRNRTTVQITNAIGSVRTMNFLSFITSSENDSIAYVLNNDPPVPPVDSPDAIILPSGGKSKVLISNRHAMTSSLSDLFVDSVNGNSSDNTIANSISRYVTSQYESFGGSESLHESTTIRNIDYRGNSNLLNASPSPRVSIIRSGYIQKFCDDTLSVSKSVENLLLKAGLTVSSPVNLQNVDSVFELFSPGRPATPALLQSLVDIGQAATSNGQSNTDAWRYLILPLCTSGIMELI